MSFMRAAGLVIAASIVLGSGISLAATIRPVSPSGADWSLYYSWYPHSGPGSEDYPSGTTHGPDFVKIGTGTPVIAGYEFASPGDKVTMGGWAVAPEAQDSDDEGSGTAAFSVDYDFVIDPTGTEQIGETITAYIHTSFWVKADYLDANGRCSDGCFAETKLAGPGVSFLRDYDSPTNGFVRETLVVSAVIGSTYSMSTRGSVILCCTADIKYEFSFSSEHPGDPPVPEPSTRLMLALGICGLLARSRRD